jgi:hypothetical protein
MITRLHAAIIQLTTALIYRLPFNLNPHELEAVNQATLR